MMTGFGMGFGFVGWFFVLFLLGWMVIIAVWALKSFSKGSQQNSSSSSMNKSNPIEILGQRYARGEITQEQYETMKQDLL
jgi:putative membrane protein